MRILQVIHQFPPYSSQGSEVYCLNLSKELRETDDVRVFHTSTPPRRRRRRLAQSTHAGLPTYHCLDRAEHSRVAAWPNAFLRRSFQTVLDEFEPEVVHFHNFLSLGDNLVSMARSSGAAVVYTLHDYGLICPNALLFRSDETLCTKQTADFFQDCCPVAIRTGGNEHRPWTGQLPSLAGWRLYAQHHPQAITRAVLLSAVGLAERLWGDPRTTDVPNKREFFFSHTRRIFRDADLFLAPSQFLLRRYVSCGLPADKVVHTRYGMRLFARNGRNGTQPQVRFGYVGALRPHKGIALLLEAFEGLGDRASLHVHGSAFSSRVSQNYRRGIRRQQAPNVVFHGAYDNDRIDEIFKTLDVIVVPSLWYENSPLTIQEAFISGTPVITADVGGMAELVRDGVDGLHFRHGDAVDLRRKLLRIIDEPEILDRLRKGIPSVVGIEQHASELRDRYQKLLRQKRLPIAS